MKTLFRSVAQDICGSPLAFSPSTGVSNEKGARAHYYFFSPRRLARNLAHTGTMNLIKTEGKPIQYTSKNFDGRQPSRDASLMHVTFEPQPTELRIIIDRETYLAYRKRNSITTPSLLLTETASRPVQQPKDFDPKENLG